MGALGGVANQWIAIFEELSKRNVPFIFFNFEGSDMMKIIKKKGIKNFPLVDIDNFDWNTLPDLVTEEDVMVITSFDHFLYRFLKVNPKIIYYNLSQYIGQISGYKYGLNFKKLGGKLIKLLDEKNAFAPMDGGRKNESYTELGYQAKFYHFLPITVDRISSNLYVKNNGKKLVCCYIGRSVDWKMIPLKRILKDFLLTETPVVFHIIVSSYKEMLNHIPLQEFSRKNIEFIIKENLPIEELNDYLKNTHIDIGFGMGTSVLDFAKLGIPSIVVDYGKKDFPDNYKYVWLADTEEYNLGDDMDKHLQNNPKRISLQHIVSNITTDDNYLKKKSDETWEYINREHSKESTVDKLCNIAEKTEFRLQMAQKYVPYFWKAHNLLKNISR